jgi:hypothetical protein
MGFYLVMCGLMIVLAIAINVLRPGTGDRSGVTE